MTELAYCGECLERHQVIKDPDGQHRLEEHTTPHGFACGGSRSIIPEEEIDG